MPWTDKASLTLKLQNGGYYAEQIRVGDFFVLFLASTHRQFPANNRIIVSFKFLRVQNADDESCGFFLGGGMIFGQAYVFWGY